MIVTIVLVVASSGLAIVFQSVNSYFGLLGGTAGVLMSAGIPSLCYWKLQKLSTGDRLALSLVVIVFAFAVAGAILSVIDPA